MTFRVCNGPSPVAMALFDLPWTLVFILGIFIFHPYLGYLAIAGGIILVIVAIANQFTSKVPLQNANEATFHAETMGEQMRSGADTIQALGMRKAAFQRWIDLRNKSLRAGIKAGDLGGGFGSVSKTFRLFLQSAMLGLGAYLVLEGELTLGAMIAGSFYWAVRWRPLKCSSVSGPSLIAGARGGRILRGSSGLCLSQRHAHNCRARMRRLLRIRSGLAAGRNEGRVARRII